MLKMLTIASMSLALATGAALAQTSTPSAETPDQANNSPSAPSNLSEEETAMMEDWRGREGFIEAFFTDDTMTTLRTDDEISSAYGAMSTEQQDMIKADCEKAETNRGVYGDVTIGFCTAVGAL